MLKIANIKFQSQIVLAPMAGVADSAFRQMAREGGAALVYSELVSSEGLVRDSKKSEDLMRFEPVERPFGIQLFGSEPEIMAEAARIAERFKPDLIDINFGCPVKKVVRNGAGAALLKNLPLLGRIVYAVTGATVLPVTVKIRSGWDADSIVAVEAATICESEGAKAVAVHARTRQMGYSGRADWSVIRNVKQAVGIPVFGNGDVVEAADAARMMRETGCEGVMVGRGAMGRPWIFRRMQHYLETGTFLAEPAPQERLAVCLRHYDLAVRQMGEYKALREMRKHASCYIRGMRGASRMRQAIFQVQSLE